MSYVVQRIQALLGKDLTVAGDWDFTGAVDLSGTSSLSTADIDINGNADISGTLDVGNNVTITGAGLDISRNGGQLDIINSSLGGSGVSLQQFSGGDFEIDNQDGGEVQLRVSNSIVLGVTSSEVNVEQDLDVNANVDISGTINFSGTMGNSSKSPTTDAPTDWVEIEIGGTTYYLPAYTAS